MTGPRKGAELFIVGRARVAVRKEHRKGGAGGSVVEQAADELRTIFFLAWGRSFLLAAFAALEVGNEIVG